MPLSTSDPRKGIPRGALRVVGFDPANVEWFPVDETRIQFDACRLADSVNVVRKDPGEVAYFVYDQDATRVHGPRNLAYEARHCVSVRGA